MGLEAYGGAGERGTVRSPMRSGKHRKGASKFRMKRARKGNAPRRSNLHGPFESFEVVWEMGGVSKYSSALCVFVFQDQVRGRNAEWGGAEFLFSVRIS
jgi:hypothetical protein